LAETILNIVQYVYAAPKLINGILNIQKEGGNLHARLAYNFNGAVNLLLKRIHAQCAYSVCILRKILSIIYHAN